MTNSVPPKPDMCDAIPAGWKLVPIEPTAEMVREAWRCTQGVPVNERMANLLLSPRDAHDVKTRHRWAAMLAAAPEPQT